MTDLVKRLEGHPAADGRRASLTQAVVRAAALGVREHPAVGARRSDGGLLHPERIDVGVAVALEEGLIVPAVRDVPSKDVVSIGAEVAALAARARAGTLTVPDTEGAAVSVTNLGAHRVDAFTPLLNPPQSAIIGVGRARPRPAAREGRVEVRTMMVLSLTFDHRVVDGFPAAAYLTRVIELLERPEALLR